MRNAPRARRSVVPHQGDLFPVVPAGWGAPPYPVARELRNGTRTEQLFARSSPACKPGRGTYNASEAIPLRDRIAQKLLESSLISQDQLARALESQQSQWRHALLQPREDRGHLRDGLRRVHGPGVQRARRRPRRVLDRRPARSTSFRPTSPPSSRSFPSSARGARSPSRWRTPTTSSRSTTSSSSPASTCAPWWRPKRPSSAASTACTTRPTRSPPSWARWRTTSRSSRTRRRRRSRRGGRGEDAPVVKLVNSLHLGRGGKRRQRYSHRTLREDAARALPHRRHAARDDVAALQDEERDHLAPQDHGRARHRGEARPAGRPHQDPHARQADRPPRQHAARRSSARRS